MIKNNIGDNIKTLRLSLNMTQKELADKMCVSHGCISSWEKNRTEPNMGAVEALTAIFNCKKTDIIGEVGQNSLELNERMLLYYKKLLELQVSNTEFNEMLEYLDYIRRSKEAYKKETARIDAVLSRIHEEPKLTEKEVFENVYGKTGNKILKVGVKK